MKSGPQMTGTSKEQQVHLMDAGSDDSKVLSSVHPFFCREFFGARPHWQIHRWDISRRARSKGGQIGNLAGGIQLSPVMVRNRIIKMESNNPRHDQLNAPLRVIEKPTDSGVSLHLADFRRPEICMGIKLATRMIDPAKDHRSLTGNALVYRRQTWKSPGVTRISAGMRELCPDRCLQFRQGNLRRIEIRIVKTCGHDSNPGKKRAVEKTRTLQPQFPQDQSPLFRSQYKSWSTEMILQIRNGIEIEVAGISTHEMRLAS